MIETLVYLIIVLVLLGIVLWVVQTYFVPIPQPVLIGIMVIVLLVLLLYFLGHWPTPRGRTLP